MKTIKTIGSYLLAGLYIFAVVLFYLIKNLVVGVVKAIIAASKKTIDDVKTALNKPQTKAPSEIHITPIIKDAVQPQA